MKACKTCGFDDDEVLFSKTKGNYKSHCDECAKHREKAIRYKTSVEHIKHLMYKQECDVCTLPFENSKSKCIDHCHTTNEIRGVLCTRCNFMLGYSRDNIQILKNGIKYLKKQAYYEL